MDRQYIKQGQMKIHKTKKTFTKVCSHKHDYFTTSADFNAATELRQLYLTINGPSHITIISSFVPEDALLCPLHKQTDVQGFFLYCLSVCQSVCQSLYLSATC